MYLTWGVRLTKFLANIKESREESMIFDVYFPATVHAAYTHRQRERGLIISRDMRRVPTRLVGNVTVRWSITSRVQPQAAQAQVACVAGV